MKHAFLIISLLIILSGCSKKTDSGTNATITPPAKTSLLFPVQNAPCTSGTVVSSTQTTITFNWAADVNSDSYDIYIKNLLTATTAQQTVTTNQVQVTLLSGTPYSWYIVAKSSKTTVTAQTDTWKFYISGAGVISHPPYPADALKPTLFQNVTATTGATNLSWTGADPDNDIATYDVYFGTASTPVLFKSGVTDQFLNSVTVTSGTTYYWKVITKDAAGNTSDSGIFQFKVN